MNWRFPLTHLNDPEFKSRFQDEVRDRFTKLATALGWQSADYDVYATAKDDGTLNGIFLHHDRVILGVFAWKANVPLSLYKCRSRQDRDGAPTHHMPIDYLDDLPRLAAKISGVLTQTPTSLPEFEINWREPLPVHPDSSFESRFQTAMRSRFARLAACLGWNNEDYDLYTAAHDGSSWESIYLHHDACFLVLHPSDGLMVLNACRSRTDHWGSTAAYMPPDVLDDIPQLARKVAGITTLCKFAGRIQPFRLD